MMERSFKVDKLNIHFFFDWLPDGNERRCTVCVIETQQHEFSSGTAVLNPKEYAKEMIGYRISLKRACEALDWIFGDDYYKHFWHEIRLQLRNERLTKELEAAKKTLEESNGQNAS